MSGKLATYSMEDKKEIYNLLKWYNTLKPGETWKSNEIDSIFKVKLKFHNFLKNQNCVYMSRCRGIGQNVNIYTKRFNINIMDLKFFNKATVEMFENGEGKV
jgi:hypothetical protein